MHALNHRAILVFLPDLALALVTKKGNSYKAKLFQNFLEFSGEFQNCALLDFPLDLENNLLQCHKRREEKRANRTRDTHFYVSCYPFVCLQFY